MHGKFSALAAVMLTSALLTFGGPSKPGAARTGFTAPSGLPASTLDVRVDGRWVRWWRSDHAPARWRAPHRALTSAAGWESVRPGVDVGTLRLRGRGEAWRLRVVLVRLDPSRVRWRQVLMTRDYGALGAWSIDSVRPSAVVAFNGGHFAGGEPWGWIIREGAELQPPGTGTLAAAIVRYQAGAVRIIPPDSIAAVRGRGELAEALQSYPMLLRDDGVVPTELRSLNPLIDLGHRDARIAACELRDGRMVVALTRFDGLDGRLSSLPFGPTIPEMVAIMGGLGCRAALLLDGGISAQLLVQPANGPRLEWKGMRRVPVGIVVEDR